MRPENGEAHNNKHDHEIIESERTCNTSKGEKRKQNEKGESVPYHRLFSFADSNDIVLMIVGTIGAIGNGLGMPIMALLFGQMVDSFGKNQFSPDIVNQVSKV